MTTEREVRDAQFQARCSLAALNFFRAHRELAYCEANKQILFNWCDERLLDCSVEANLENAHLFVHEFMAKAEKNAPVPVADTPVQETPPATEDEQLRQILRDNKNDPRAAATAVRQILKAKDAANEVAARRHLPEEYTRQRLLKASGPELRDLQKRYGFDAINEALNQR